MNPRRSFILTVPDEETARRLTLEFGEKCGEIAPRTLELGAAAVNSKSVKKLEALGIFLRPVERDPKDPLVLGRNLQRTGSRQGSKN